MWSAPSLMAGSAFNDGQVSRRDLAFHPDLAAGVLRHAPLTPAAHTGNIEVRQARHNAILGVRGRTHQPS